MTVGVKGKIVDGWDYDASWQHSIVNLTQSAGQNYFSTDENRECVERHYRSGSLPNGKVNPSAGQAECVAAYNGTSPACVPYNIFSLGQVTQAALNYLEVPGTSNRQYQPDCGGREHYRRLGQVRRAIADGGFRLEIQLRLRVARRHPVDEPRRRISERRFGRFGRRYPVRPPAASSRAKPLPKARLPLIEDKFLAQSTGFGNRLSLLRLQPRIQDQHLQVRSGIFAYFGYPLAGSFQRAVRAPNVTEFFSAANWWPSMGIRDPCAGTAAQPRPSAHAAQCVAAGVPAAAYGTVTPNSADQYNGLIGGNPGLEAGDGIDHLVWYRLDPGIRAQLRYRSTTSISRSKM